MNKIKILIADDHPVFRFGLATLLDTEPGLEIVGEVGNGVEAVAQAKELVPDVILMDINMPDLNGIEATRQIKAQLPSVSILVLSMLDDDTVFSAMRAGASGYLLKGLEGEETVQAVRHVAAGGTIFSPGIADRVLEFFSTRAAPGGKPFPELTDREREILGLIARGLTNSAIAERLVISPKTVRNVVSEIYSKLQVSSRGDAVEQAKRAGLGRNRPE